MAEALFPEFYVGDLRVDDYPFSVVRGDGGLDLGAGANVMNVVDSLLQDGEIESSSRTGNRTLVLPLYVEGADLAELAANEDILIQACEKQRNTFSLVVGDDFGPTTVFDTFRIQARHVRNDDEEAHLMRRWDLTIPALPWARSADLSTTTFTTGAGTATTVDAASALTNWSLISGSAALSTTTWLADAAVKVDATAVGYGTFGTYLVRWSGTVPAANYVALDVATPDNVYVGPNAGGGNVWGSGVKLGDAYPLATVVQASGYTRFYFETPAAGPLDFYIVGASYVSPDAGPDFYIGGLYSSATFPGVGLLIAEVPGSVRSPGALVIERADGVPDSLTDLMVFSDPAMISHGYQPDVFSTWKDAPAGRYVLYVDPQAPGGYYNYSADSVIAASFTSAGGAVQTVRTRYGTEPGQWRIIGILEFGGNRDGRIGDLTMTLLHYATAGTEAVYSPTRMRLFRMADDTALTHLRDNVPTPVILDIPSIDFPRGGVWADGVDALPSAKSWAFPFMTPPLTALFVADEDSLYSTGYLKVRLDHYAHWHTYAGT